MDDDYGVAVWITCYLRRQGQAAIGTVARARGTQDLRSRQPPRGGIRSVVSTGVAGNWAVSDPSVLEVVPASSGATIHALGEGIVTVSHKNELGGDSARIVVLNDSENLLQVMRRCPTVAEVELLFLVAAVEFQGARGPTSGCSFGDQAMLTTVSRLAQYLSVLARLRFDEPLPWTDETLIEWFADLVHVLILDAELDFAGICCDATRGGIFLRNTPSDPFQLPDTTALEVVRAVDGAIGLLKHEARHFGFSHTCSHTDDNTVTELGAHAVDYLLGVWIGHHSSGNVIPPARRPFIQAGRRAALAHICTPPQAFDVTLHAARGSPQLDGVGAPERIAIRRLALVPNE